MFKYVYSIRYSIYRVENIIYRFVFLGAAPARSGHVRLSIVGFSETLRPSLSIPRGIWVQTSVFATNEAEMANTVRFYFRQIRDSPKSRNFANLYVVFPAWWVLKLEELTSGSFRFVFPERSRPKSDPNAINRPRTGTIALSF